MITLVWPHRMTYGRMVTNLYGWKPIFTRLAGRPKINGKRCNRRYKSYEIIN